MYTKGAPEVVLGKCTRELSGGEPRDLTDVRRREIVDAANAMAGRALRVLGLAYREAFKFGDIGYGNAIAVVMVAIGAVFAAAYVFSLRRGERES